MVLWLLWLLLLLLVSPLEVSLDRLRQAATRKQCRVCTTATLEGEEEQEEEKEEEEKMHFVAVFGR